MERRCVLCVEGESDRLALHGIAALCGVEVTGEIRVMGGITNLGHHLSALASDGVAADAVGVLYDDAEEAFVERTLRRFPDQQVARFGCTRDLEDELVRSLGIRRTLEVIERAGDLGRWHTLRHQPHHRDADPAAVMRRFFGTTSGRKARYAHLLTAALNPDDVPPVLADAIAFLAPGQEP